MKFFLRFGPLFVVVTLVVLGIRTGLLLLSIAPIGFPVFRCVLRIVFSLPPMLFRCGSLFFRVLLSLNRFLLSFSSRIRVY